MKRKPSRSRARSLTDELAELRRLDLSAVKQRWRVLYRTEAPAHISRACMTPGIRKRGRPEVTFTIVTCAANAADRRSSRSHAQAF